MKFRNRSAKQILVHEVTRSEHRIVIVKGDGTNVAGEWSALGDVAVNGKYHAIVGESKLPQGIFTCTDHAHQVLS